MKLCSQSFLCLLCALIQILPLAKSTAEASDKSKPVSFVPDGFTNSLGMKFVPVPGTKLSMCIHETRVCDYAAYAKENADANGTWKRVTDYDRRSTEVENHPIIGVNWEEAKQFGEWLSRKETRAYRLPTDREWSIAVGIGSIEVSYSGRPTRELDGKIPNVYPWGAQWPPPARSGNFCDTTCSSKYKWGQIDNYDDGMFETGEVMQFTPTPAGLYDMAGNVSEWVEDWYDVAKTKHTLRGGNFTSSTPKSLLSSARSTPHVYPDRQSGDTERGWHQGFRLVVEIGRTIPAAASSTTSGAAENRQESLNEPVASSQPSSSLQGTVTNNLGMKFVPVPGTGILMCIHETRASDFLAYHEVTGAPYPSNNDRNSDKPVIFVRPAEAEAFCDWLTEWEGKKYRLPTDLEWSFAAGIGEEESQNGNLSPKALLVSRASGWPWGNTWPPPAGSGNFADESFAAVNARRDCIRGYKDGYEFESSVMSFKPNKLGIYDLAGNASEWVGDWSDETHTSRVLRGGGCRDSERLQLESAAREFRKPNYYNTYTGFRVVLDPREVAAASLEVVTPKTQTRPKQLPAGKTLFAEPPPINLGPVGELLIPSIRFMEISLLYAAKYISTQSQRIDPRQKGIAINISDRIATWRLSLSLDGRNVAVKDAVRYITMLTETQAFLNADGSVQLNQRPNDWYPAEAAPSTRIQRRASVVLPEVSFAKATLQEALEFIRLKGLELDPDGSQVPILLMTYNLPYRTPITLDLKNVHLGNALNCIATMAGAEVTCIGDAFWVSSLTYRPPHASAIDRLAAGVPPRLGSVQDLVIPTVIFAGASVEDAISFVRNKSRDLDPQKAGANIAVKVYRDSGLKITFRASNITVGETLRYIAILGKLDYTMIGQIALARAAYNPEQTVATNKPSTRLMQRSAHFLPVVEFKDAELPEVADFLSLKGKDLDPAGGDVAILLDPAVTGQVTLNLTNVSLLKALQHLAKVVNSELLSLGDAFYIAPQKSTKAAPLAASTAEAVPHVASVLPEPQAPNAFAPVIDKDKLRILHQLLLASPPAQQPAVAKQMLELTKLLVQAEPDGLAGWLLQAEAAVVLKDPVLALEAAAQLHRLRAGASGNPLAPSVLAMLKKFISTLP